MTNKIAEIEKIYIIPEFVKLNPEKISGRAYRNL